MYRSSPSHLRPRCLPIDIAGDISAQPTLRSVGHLSSARSGLARSGLARSGQARSGLARSGLTLFGLALLCLGLLSATAHAQEGRGCSVFKPCPNGFTCEAFTHKCRGPGREGDSCHATRPCGRGLTCEAGSHKCRGPVPEGGSCHATRPCASGLTCEAGSHKCRRPGKPGDPCHATRPCGGGLSCQPGVHKCYHTPRKPGEPCSAGYGCGEGFYCQSFTHKCVPKTVEYNSNSPCGSLRVQAVAEDARRMGKTMSFGVGSSAGAGPFASYETGLVYGEGGQFGCYASACVGAQADANVSTFANFGIYQSYRSFEGFSMVTGVGADVPFIELGFQTSQAWSAEAPKRAKDFLKGRLIGTASGLSFGVGLNPVNVSTSFCYTARLDSGDPLSNFKDIKRLLSDWGKAGFAPDRRPQRLGGGAAAPPPPPPAASGPKGSKCADEGGRCQFQGRGRVHYGAREKWAVRETDGGIDCNNQVFGDPLRGVRKACFVEPLGAPPPAGGGRVITLRSHHGKFVVAESNGEANANRDRVGQWERWQLIQHPDGKVSLRSHHGKYLVAEQDGRARANRDRIGPWERWTLVRNQDGTVSLRSHHGKFLVAESDGKLNANRPAAREWERFRMAAP